MTATTKASNELTVNENTVLRELGVTEKMYDVFSLEGLCKVVNAVHVELQPTEGISLNLEVLKRSCSRWMRKYPLLQTTVYRKITEDGLHYEMDSYQFVRIKSDPFALTNVDFLSANQEQLTWESLMEKEIQTPLDVHNGPMWRLKVLEQLAETSTISNHQLRKFVFVLHISHTVTDGKNISFMLNDLFDMIVDELLSKSNDEITVVDSPQGIESYLAPDFKSFQFGQLWPVNHQSFDLSTVHCEVARVDSATLCKLKKKLKEKTRGEGKITGLFEVIISLAYQQLKAKYNFDDDSNVENCLNHKEHSSATFRYRLSINMRDKCAVNQAQMGLFVSGLFVDDCPTGLTLDSVWSQTEKCSRDLHHRMDNEEHVASKIHTMDALKKAHSSNNAKFIIDVLPRNGDKDNDNCLVFNLSNIGVVAQTVNRPLLKATEYYCSCYYRNLNVSLVTIDNAACFTLNYSVKYIKRELVRELASLIAQTANALVDQE